MTDFALKSQRVVTPKGLQPATVVIRDEIITAVLTATDNTPDDIPIEDLGNLVLMPGLVDTHVHINEPGRTDWEGFDTATRAAAAGGITTLVDMPLNCIPVTTTKAALGEKLMAVSEQLWVDCGFWGGVIPSSLEALDDLLAAGVLGVKSFMIDSGIDEFPEVKADDIRQAMPILAKYQAPYLIHAELDHSHHSPGDIGDQYQSFLHSRPRQWENDAIDLIIKLAHEGKTQGIDCRFHIVHLSSADAIAKIATAKAAGLSISVETCPHYLTFYAEAIPDGKTLFKCCPPIREKENREQLWQGLRDGVIDFIVSDHSPCTPALKEIDSGDLEKAWGGISALQFGLPLIWTEARQRGFSLVDLTSLMSTRTAQFAGLKHIKGKIAAGYHADLVVFDDAICYDITAAMIKHKHKISPYTGYQVQGKVVTTFLRGQVIFNNDHYGNRPTGKPLLRDPMTKKIFNTSV